MSEWLLELTGWITQFIPRLSIVCVTHKVVKFRYGSDIVLVEPGMMWHWPLVTQTSFIPVVRQPIDLPTQRLVTADHKRVIASASVTYRVSDPIKAITHNWDYEDTIVNVSRAAVASIITKRPYDDLVGTIAGQLKKDLTRACREELKKYGISVHECLLTDFCQANVIALSNSDYRPPMLGDGDDE